MKKTTMRIVGFLLAAAALVFVTGCPQPESAKKPEPQKPAPQFDYSTLKNTKWMVYSFMDTNHAGIGNEGYFFVFDDKAVPELRVAYDADTTSANDAKTRAQKVTYTITGLDKIAIPELNLAEAKPFVIKASDPAAENQKSLTITVETKKIILVPTEDTSTFTTDNSPENVVAAFNTLTGAPKWDINAEKSKVWQVMKIKGKDVTEKKLYIAFTNTASKIRVAHDAGASNMYANADTDYSLGAPVLGNETPTITIADLSITAKQFSWSGEAGSRTVITEDDTSTKVELKEVSIPAFATVSTWTATDKATVLAKFAE